MVERSELAAGWAVDEPILSIGGSTTLDEAAAAVLAEVLKKRGLGAKVLEPDAISAAHIASLAGTEAKLICLSYPGLRHQSSAYTLPSAALAAHHTPRHAHPRLLPG